jgi:hypothetical protein
MGSVLEEERSGNNVSCDISSLITKPLARRLCRGLERVVPDSNPNVRYGLGGLTAAEVRLDDGERAHSSGTRLVQSESPSKPSGGHALQSPKINRLYFPALGSRIGRASLELEKLAGLWPQPKNRVLV